ncbi:putative thioredoxin [Microlunatus sagamiharensis]|uniref:Putative thioredoxin n=1 Tax=Microlunatus sagamiharensis TaxID=546874 RepID=A0A1H2MAQ2_9ACTN|nr:tetratricopeptide repeat protein [Microlunatus sagamiharensis]SDU89556.1 putative thioredoxin [Microlunatus sagamiharensis]
MSSSSFSRPGAIDLSQLAARAKAAPAPGGPAAPGASAPSGGASYVLESSEQTFESDAIRPSTQHPVVVELYSPRVASGQQLSDALAAVANASEGRFLLVRLNVDAAPGIVQALQLQAVPTVLAIISGQAVPLFQGVLPAEQVQQAVDQVLKTAVANGMVGRARPVAAGTDPEDGAEAPGEDQPDPRFAAADEALAQGDFARARDEFDRLLQANPNDAEAALGKAQAGLFARASVLDPEATLARAAEGGDVAAQLDAADVELVSGRVEEAFDRLLAVVRRGGADRDPARVRLLELFETVGGTDPRVVAARRSLMAALF